MIYRTALFSTALNDL